MDVLPGSVVQHVQSQLNSAGVSCSLCGCMLFLPMLYFPRHLLTRQIGQMVETTLEELVIYYPFSAMCLPLWLVLPSASLDFDMSSVASSGWIRVPRLDRRRAEP